MSFEPGGVLVIPSPIDVHAHLRQPGGEDMETISSGTRAARLGGYQAVFDMPNNPGGNETWTLARLEQKFRYSRRTSETDIGFYAGVNLIDPALGEFQGMVAKAAGLKLYMGHTTGNTKEFGLDEAREPIDEWIYQARELGITPPVLLHAREGIGAETAEYILRQGYPVHWCHIATESEVEYAARLTKLSPEFYTGGVTPHHLTMTSRDADFQLGWNARMQPPLGKEVDADALVAAYNRRDIQILETDHAPHPDAKKLTAESDNPKGLTEVGNTTCFGVSGIEFVLPVMTALAMRGIITMDTLVDSLYYQPAKMLGLRIGKTATATTTLAIDPYVITPEHIRGKSHNTPYIGSMAWAKVIGSRTTANQHQGRPVTILRNGMGL